MISEPHASLELKPSARPASAAWAPDTAETSFSETVRLLRANWRLFAAITGTLVVLITAVTLLTPRRYTATAAFLPQSKQVPSSLASLAAQFQVRVPMGDAGSSSQYYLDLLQSRDLLRAVVLTSYSFPTSAGVVNRTLVDFYDLNDKTAEGRVDRTIRRLKADMTPRVSPKSGLIRLNVTQENPQLASLVLSQILKLLADFNVQSHQSQAAAERRFAEQRRMEAHQDLRVAENRLQQFLQGNRVSLAPALRFEEERLAREVATQQQLYVALSQAYEQARMEEVRDTPVFTVIEKPAPPPRPDSRALVFKVFLALALGVTVALLDIVVRQKPRKRQLA